MTVSPRRPQDNTPTPPSVDDSVAVDDSISGSMPPTLFRLPNLSSTPEPAVSPSTAAAEPTPIQSRAEDQVQVNPSAMPLPAILADPDTRPDDGQSKDESLPGATSYPNDTPAGRSWMDVAQQHGVVLVLLLAVVATAIFTGRKPGTEKLDAAIAETLDSFEIENGIATDLPMPKNGHGVETDIVSAHASLETPYVKEPDSTVAMNQSNEETDAAAEFLRLIDAQTVSSRIEETVAVESEMVFSPPTLEYLADSLSDDKATITPNENQVQLNLTVPVPSKTPIGISDWSQYLPALPSATSK